MRPWRTQTRPNGSPGVRETVYGWDAVTAVTAIIALLVGIAAGGLAAWISLSNQVASNRAEQLLDRYNFKKDVASEVSGLLKAGDFVTRDEWLRHNADVADALKDAQAENRRLFNYLIAGDRYNRRILSQLPGAQEDRP